MRPFDYTVRTLSLLSVFHLGSGENRFIVVEHFQFKKFLNCTKGFQKVNDVQNPLPELT